MPWLQFALLVAMHTFQALAGNVLDDQASLGNLKAQLPRATIQMYL
jgi:hypothetical protein